MRRSCGIAVGLAPFLALGAGCVAPRLAYTPDDLRAEVRRRAPDVAPSDVFVPHEITPAQAKLARAVVGDARSDKERVHRLLAAMFDPGSFGLRYCLTPTTTAKETFERREGNCLGLAATFIGLAREVGLKAYYIDASSRVHETRRIDDMTVNSGHVTAVVEAGDEKVGLDFGQMGRIVWYRVLDDVEALAHFHNNRGFERLDGGGGPDWAAAEREFHLAVELWPGFARAWNNLGIAAAHQGRPEEALADYRAAIARDPRLAAPLNNLGALELERGDDAEALRAFEAAARLEPDGSHIQYHLAEAMLRLGDRRGAVRALRRALHLRADYPEAQAMLARIGASAN